MEKVLEIASSISTPLGLSGLFAAFLFFIFKQILEKNIFPALSRALGGQIITLIIERLFVLALVAMILGFVGYLIARLVPPSAARTAVASCRHPDFGQEGWVRTETVAQSSGWRGGGRSQPDWCNELASSFIRGRSIGPQHAVEVVRSSESSKKDVLGHASYNYSCTLKISWEPLYFERQDPRCALAR